MIETIVTATLLGFFAGGVPGPFTTVVASTALDRGFKSAFKLTFIPIVTETPALVVTVFILKSLNYDLLNAVGVLGGLSLGYLGVRFYQRQGQDILDEDYEDRHDFRALAVAGLLSPAPWIFWLVAAGPLFLRSWNRSWMHGALFVVVLFAMFIGTANLIAWLASHGRRIMVPATRRKVLRGVGVFLVIAGGVLIWQSLEGNFQGIVQRQEALRERVR